MTFSSQHFDRRSEFMLTTRFLVKLFSFAMMALGAGVVSGQDYPNRLIRIVVGAPGDTNDFMARLIAQRVTGSLGQPVIVENRGGIISMETVAKAPPDGYTLSLQGFSAWILPLLQKTSYDPVRDFSPIILVASAPGVLAVHPLLPVKSVKELIALAKTRPGELNYGAPGTGTSPHLGAELFKAMAGIDLMRIPYKGMAPALNALISGETQLMFPAAAAVTPHMKSGKLRALAVTSAQPSALVPGVPTVAASGVPGYESRAMWGMSAPAKTPTAIIGRLNREVVEVLNSADVKEKFFSVGLEVVGSSPEQFAAYMKSDMTRMGKVITDAGIRGE